MSKLKLPVIIVIVLAALGAGLYMSGMVGKSEGPVKKHVIEPVSLGTDFTVNLADADSSHYVVLNVALQLEPMDEEHWAAWSGAGGGGHGGGGEAPGPIKMAAYPKFHDAVVATVSTFDFATLKSPEGKQELREALLTRFAEIAEEDEADYKAGAPEEGHVGPPYHVLNVYFPKYLLK